MTLTNTVVAKFAVATVAVAMMFSALAPVASAQNVSQMSLDELIALVTQLQAQLGQGSSTGSTSCVSIPAPLTIGAQGANVTALQNRLIADGQVIPAGATGYFGVQTQSALAAWQAAHGVSPAAGYYGPITMAAMDAACVPTPSDDDDDDDDDTSGPVDLSGEADLDSFEIDDASDDEAEEGETSEIGVFTLEFTDGDAEISRIDIALLAEGDANTNDVQPWRAFESVALVVDGDVVAEVNADDEDDYLDEDDGSLRFTGLDIVAMEDEELEISVEATVMNGVDADEMTDWTLYALAIRYFDADGVATTENSLGDLSGNENPITGGVAATFEIVEEGSNDDATIERSSSNPDASTLKVEDDSDESEEFDIFIFEIEIDEDSGTLELDDMIVDIEVTNPEGNATTSVDDVIEEVTLTINGQTEDGDASNSDLTHVISAYGDDSHTAAYTFEFDGLELDADETYEAVLSVVFKGQDTDAYENNVTVQAFVDGADAQLEGAAGDNVLTGTEESKVHTLATVVPIVTDVDSSITQANQVSNSGSIVFEFTIEADEDDVVLTRASLDAAAELISSASTTLAKPTPSLARVGGDTSVESPSGTFTIEEGDEVTFRLTYTFTTASDHNNGNYSINLETIAGVEVDETSPNLTLAHS